jgi:hypothetical protein
MTSDGKDKKDGYSQHQYRNRNRPLLHSRTSSGNLKAGHSQEQRPTQESIR